MSSEAVPSTGSALAAEGVPKPGAPEAGSPSATTPAAKPKRKRRWLRRVLLGTVLAAPVAALALWIAIHRVEWLGPWLADTGRAIVGNDAIAWLEDTLYGVQDEYNLATKGDQAPTAHWEVPAETPPPANPDKPSVYPAFTVKNVEPMHTSFSAPGDGQW